MRQNTVNRIITNLFDDSYGSSYGGNIYDTDLFAPTLMTTYGDGLDV